ncbi:MAG: hypothetical protein ORN54_02740 [Cyclobacteriaceae bacterium]|nr:hypothetical protein [Cyclobacteriaceae bacterium]
MPKSIIFLCVFAFAFSQSKLVKTKVAEGITISMPSELTPMTTDDIVQRYPSVRAPLAAYTNGNRTADFSVNTSATQWPDGDINLAQKFFKAGIGNLYDRIDFIDQGVHELHKRKFIFFEFESRVNGNRMKEGEQSAIFRYTYIQYFVEKDRAIVFSFSCPRDQKSEWQPTVRAMMKSVKLKQ